MKIQFLILFIFISCSPSSNVINESNHTTSEVSQTALEGSDPLFKYQWYLDNLEWVNNIVSGDYLNYYENQYVDR